MPKNPTAKQVRFLFSKGSPLSTKQKEKFRKELHSGKAHIRKKKG